MNPKSSSELALQMHMFFPRLKEEEEEREEERKTAGTEIKKKNNPFIT